MVKLVDSCTTRAKGGATGASGELGVDKELGGRFLVRSIVLEGGGHEQVG